MKKATGINLDDNTKKVLDITFHACLRQTKSGSLKNVNYNKIIVTKSGKTRISIHKLSTCPDINKRQIVRKTDW